jgi:enoyl-CoA hydratase/carnithine racemase
LYVSADFTAKDVAYQNIVTELRGATLVIRLNRPDVRNALSSALMRELGDALAGCEMNPDIRVVVITGGQHFFSAGADIREMSERSVADMYLSAVSDLWSSVSRYPKPIIAAINGFAYGGGLELAMACDMIVCAEDAKLGQPEIKLGIIPGAGGTQRLPRVVGKHKAMEMVLTGEPIGAREAKELGLVNRVVPPEAVLEEALRIAAAIAERAPVAVRAAKEAVLRGLEVDLESGLAYEKRLFALLFATEDSREGLRAFLEKREPQYKGR